MNMTFKTFFFALLLSFACTTALAAETTATPAKPTVATIYINNAKSTYDDELSQKLSSRFNRKLSSFTLQNDPKVVAKLNDAGITDISVAERGDIVQIFADENIDYIVYAEIQPPILAPWVSMFNQGVKATVTIPLKIIDVKNNKYLYNGKFTETADNSAVFGGVGTKAAVFKAMDKIFDKTDDVLRAKLPLK